MKKICLFVLAVFASLGIFANVNEVVKPDKGKEIVKKLNEYLKQKNISLTNGGQCDEKKAIFNEVTFVLTYWEICHEETVFPCDVEGFFRTETLITYQMNVLRFERDNEGNIISITVVQAWTEEESYTAGECPEIE